MAGRQSRRVVVPDERQPPPPTARLGLGTAQFGMNYGVSNNTGRTPGREVAKILELAARQGVRVLDTAGAYGRSEEVLGEILQGSDRFRIITKTNPIPTDRIDAGRSTVLKDDFYRALERLRTDRLHGLLVHRAEDLAKDGAERISRALRELKAEGLIEKAGVSIYHREQLSALPKSFPLDLVQLPVNLLDQRILEDDFLSGLRSRGVEIHARSVFLQGLLLMPPTELKGCFGPVQGHLAGLHRRCRESDITALRACLDFVLGLRVDCALVGVCHLAELQEILENARGLPADLMDYSRFSWPDPALLDPSRWNFPRSAS